jgi:anthranilate synthase component 1
MKKPCYFPSLEDFKKMAKSGSVVPVWRDVLADTETPVSAFLKIDDGHDAFLLESVEGGEKLGRFSFLGVRPRAVIKGKGRSVEIIEGGKATIKEGDPIDIVKSYMSAFKASDLPGAPKFCGGAIGYVSYDAIRYIERLPDLSIDDMGLPDIFLMVTDSLLVFDNVEHTIKVVANARVESGGSLDDVYRDAISKIDALVATLRASARREDGEPPAEARSFQVSSNFEKGRFLSAVKRIKEYIEAGDVIQTVLSQRFEAPLGSKPFDVYRALRVINPSPYMFFLRIGGVTLAGSSPEIMAGVNRERTVTVRPIAGTRRRGRDEKEDVALETELLADPKERAEHVMLVDLGRNDVGRVAKDGTVKVDELMVIERYSHVMHIVSNVSGRLKDGKDSFDAFRACFPAGTLTGAPKVRAMEIIEELEPVRRGVYGGSVGYFGFSGDMDMAITIRTVLMKDGRAYVQAGAGVVADSAPEKEFEETVNKAMGMLKAVERAAEGMDKV